MLCSAQSLTPFTLTSQFSVVDSTLASYARGLGFDSQQGWYIFKIYKPFWHLWYYDTLSYLGKKFVTKRIIVYENKMVLVSIGFGE